MVKPETNYTMPRALIEVKKKMQSNPNEPKGKCSCVRYTTTGPSPCCCGTNKTFGGTY